MIKKIPVLILAILIGAVGIFAQNNQTRKVAAGQKMKIKGVVVSKDASKIIVRDSLGVETPVTLTGETDIKIKGGIFGGGKTVAPEQVIRGLNLEVEGRGDGENLVAGKVRFGKDDFSVAQSIDSRVTPAEERLAQAEQNAQRISGQIDELMAVSNAARGGAKAAQDTADAAVKGVNATNQRISDLDDFVVQSTATVNFKVNSAVLLPEGKVFLDELAQKALTLKGYVIEVTGFASADGNAEANKILSRKRAQAVLDYLIETHNIPLRRIGVSYGFGESQAIADNATREGRAQNRRVEVKLMVSKGINQNVEVRSSSDNQ